MVASKKKTGKGKGSKSKAKGEPAVQDTRAEEAHGLLTTSAPPAPEPQALPQGEATDPQVPSETKGD